MQPAEQQDNKKQSETTHVQHGYMQNCSLLDVDALTPCACEVQAGVALSRKGRLHCILVYRYARQACTQCKLVEH